MHEPFPAHSRLGCHVIEGTYVPPPVPLVSKDTPWALKKQLMQAWRARNIHLPSYTWHLLVPHANTLCAASQHPRPKCHITSICKISQKKQEVKFSALKGTSSRLHPVAQLLYCQYHGTSLLEGLSRIISITPPNPDHLMLHTSPTFMRTCICSWKTEQGRGIKLLLSSSILIIANTE